MPTIGAMPTRTSVNLRLDDGSAGSIPAATEKSAGVMTAQQAADLERLVSAQGGWQGMSPDIPVARPTEVPSTPPEKVERAAEIDEGPEPAPNPPPVSGATDIMAGLVAELLDRVDALEAHVARLSAPAVVCPVDNEPGTNGESMGNEVNEIALISIRPDHRPLWEGLFALRAEMAGVESGDARWLDPARDYVAPDAAGNLRKMDAGQALDEFLRRYLEGARR